MKKNTLKSISYPYILLVMIAQVANHAFANDDRRIQSETATPAPLPIAQTPTPTQTLQEGTLELNENELLANPELLNRAMISALMFDNPDGVGVLLPIYQKQTSDKINDELLIWANAVLAMGNHEPKKAIAIYQTLSHNHPNNEVFAVRLGQAYFANRQYAEAKTIFLAQSPEIQRELASHLAYIAQQQKLNVSVSGNFIADKNINNAPTSTDLGGGWTASKPESANGFLLNLGADKKFFLTDGAFLLPEVSANGKFFWDARHYNELTLRAGLGIGKSWVNSSISLTPFVERTEYAGGYKDKTNMTHFSDTAGASFMFNHTKGRVQTQLSTEVSQTLYQTRPHLNGYSFGVSPTVSWYPKELPNTMLSLGLDYQYTHTRDKDDSYQRSGLRLGMGRQWENFGIRGSLNIGKRSYLAPMPIFNIRQVNQERTASISIWHHKIAYKNLMPRLTWQYQKTDSSVALYSYDKNRVFLEMGAGF